MKMPIFYRFVDRTRLLSLLVPGMLLFALAAAAQAPAGNGTRFEPDWPAASSSYPLTPDSKAQPGVPQGKIFKFQMTDSKIFPGTKRTITVYIPAQYTSKKPACLYVGLDSLSFNAPVVLDNLIAQKAIPVMIGIGVAPGSVESASAPDSPRHDRSFEFDTRSDRLARFILEEVIPGVEAMKTPNGDAIVISKDPNDHMAAGGSTGGIGAFTLAWQRPDQFRRVFTAIGTFVGMRGGEGYYVEVRKTEPKPIRIFMEDGAHDEWQGGPEMGDWWMSNLTMNRALEFAGYDVKHVWGAHKHDGSLSGQVFPEAMRWLWRDYPAPVAALEPGDTRYGSEVPPGNPRLKEIVVPGEGWTVHPTNTCGAGSNLAADPQGNVFFNSQQQIIPVSKGAGNIGCMSQSGDRYGGLAFDASGKPWLALRMSNGITRSDGSAATGSVLAKEHTFWHLVVRNNGDMYATTTNPLGASELWLIRANGETIKLAGEIKSAAGLAFSPDGLWLLVDQAESHTAVSYRVKADGTLDAPESMFVLDQPETADNPGAGGIAYDANGHAYIATAMGVQVFDRNGRVTVILPLPGNEAASSVCFGGADFSTLYVATDSGTIYKRKMKVTGVPPFAAPIKLKPEGAG